MPRSANPYYADPADQFGGQIGANLGRALFGDPQLRARQQQLQAEAALRDAQTSEAASHAGLYDAQTTGRRIQNDGAMSLPQMLAAYAGSFDTPAPPAPVPVAPPPMADHAIAASILPPGIAPPQPVIAPQPAVAAPSPDEVVVTGHHPVSHTSQLAALLAAGAMAQGDKVNPSALAASIAALSGTDEDARRSMASMGHSPSNGFALTTQRADDIAANLAATEKDKGIAVANANHASDIPVANIHAGATIGSAKIGAGATIASANIGAGARRDVANIEVKGRADLAGPGGKVKPLSAANMGMLDKQLNNGIVDRGYSVGTGPAAVLGPKGYLTPRAVMAVRTLAVKNYRAGGDPVAAVNEAFKQAVQAGGGSAPSTPRGPPIGAPAGTKQAPDGNFYAPDPSRPGKFVRVDG